MDWLAKMLGLPEKFLHHHPDSVGGGVLQVGGIRGGLINVLFSLKFFPLGDSFAGGRNKNCSVGLNRDKSHFDITFQILLLKIEDYRLEVDIAFGPNCVTDKEQILLWPYEG